MNKLRKHFRIVLLAIFCLVFSSAYAWTRPESNQECTQYYPCDFLKNCKKRGITTAACWSKFLGPVNVSNRSFYFLYQCLDEGENQWLLCV